VICCDANTVGCARWLVRWLLTTPTPLDGANISTRKPEINTIFTRVRFATWLASNASLVTIVAYMAVSSNCTERLVLNSHARDVRRCFLGRNSDMRNKGALSGRLILLEVEGVENGNRGADGKSLPQKSLFEHTVRRYMCVHPKI